MTEEQIEQKNTASEVSPTDGEIRGENLTGKIGEIRGELFSVLKQRSAMMGISTYKLAKMTGFTQPRISNILNGKVNVTLNSYIALLLILDPEFTGVCSVLLNRKSKSNE